MDSAEILRIDLKPSLCLTGALGIVHILAFVSIWVSLAGWSKYLAAAGVLVSGVACLSEAMLRRGGAAVSLELHPDGRISWRDRNGGWHEARLTGDHFVSVPFIVLGLKPGPMGRKRIMLMGDSAQARDLRRLRAWLRWKPEADSGRRKHETRIPPS